MILKKKKHQRKIMFFELVKDRDSGKKFGYESIYVPIVQQHIKIIISLPPHHPHMIPNKYHFIHQHKTY